MIQRSNDRYSQFVAWAKVGLYVAALTLLSTLFLFSSRVDVTDSLIYADLNVDDIIRDQRISNPQIATMLENGTGVVVTAALARPDETAPAVVLLDQVAAQLTGADGAKVDVMAEHGRADSAADTILLTQNMTLETDDGIIAKSDQITVDIDQGLYHTNGPTRVTGPFGQFDAGDMMVQTTSQGLQMHFTNGVRLTYKGKIQN